MLSKTTLRTFKKRGQATSVWRRENLPAERQTTGPREQVENIVMRRLVAGAFKRDIQGKLDLADVIEALAKGNGGRFRLPGGVVVTVKVERLKGRRLQARKYSGVVSRTPQGVSVKVTSEDVMPPESSAALENADAGIDAEALALEQELLAQGIADQRAVLQRPEMLTLEDASARSGIPVRTLTHMRSTGRLLGLARSGAQKGFRLPAWQFEQSVLEAMPDIISAFGPHRVWQAYDFLTHPEPLLGGQVPLEELRRGRRDAVLRILRAVAGLDEGGY
jgi:hypothetical protein